MPDPECLCNNEGRPDFHFYGCPWFAPPNADPQMQAENMDYMKMLVMVMHKHGITETAITSDEIAAMPEGLCVVIGPNPDNQTIRLRVMSQADAEKERDRE